MDSKIDNKIDEQIDTQINKQINKQMDRFGLLSPYWLILLWDELIHN